MPIEEFDTLKKFYSDLTQIDIDEQCKLWDERGKGYYGEYLLFTNLYKHIPGTCKLLMNLHIPTSNEKTTEIDAVMIHETGIYVFEIKHYKGTIYGTDSNEIWTQYFRTAPNSHFLNPIKQNQYHIDALQELYPNMNIYSYIVFTNFECDLKIKNYEYTIKVCKLNELLFHLKQSFELNPLILNIEEIDEIFNALIPYSPIKQEIITESSDNYKLPNEISINRYINTAIKEIDNYRYNLEQENIKKEKSLEYELKRKYIEETKKIKRNYNIKQNKMIFSFILIFFIIISIGLNIFFKVHSSDLNKINTYEEKIIQLEQRIEMARQENNLYKEKFEKVDELTYIDNNMFKENIFLIQNLEIKNSIELNNVVELSCEIVSNNENFGIIVPKDAKIIVIVKNGTIKEYDLWTKEYPFYRNRYIYQNSEGVIPTHKLQELNLNDISYIKLSNLGIYKIGDFSYKNLTDNYEIKLFSNTEEIK